MRAPAPLLRRLPLGLALLATACMGDCDPLSPTARIGVPQVLVSVTRTLETEARPLPAVIHQDSLRTVRILADTVRFLPNRTAYQRRTVFGVTPAGGAEQVVVSPDGTQLYPVRGADPISGVARLQEFVFVPGMPLVEGQWGSWGARSARLDVWIPAPDGERPRGYSAVYEPADLVRLVWQRDE